MKTKFLLILFTFLLAINTFATTPTLRFIDDNFKTYEMYNNYIIEDNIFLFPVRDVLEPFGYTITWNNYSKRATVHADDFRKIIYSPYIYNERIYLPLDKISDLIDKPLFYNSELNTIYTIKILTQNDLITLLPSYDNYTYEDLYWLSRIISSEARGEEYSSKIDVGNVIINRVQSPLYPNTIKEVVFDDENGVQFSPTINGHIYKTPTLDSYLASLEILEQSNIAKNSNQNALFFMNPNTATSSWIHNNRTFAFASGNHHFYY